jgi:hypothetical protein
MPHSWFLPDVPQVRSRGRGAAQPRAHERTKTDPAKHNRGNPLLRADARPPGIERTTNLERLRRCDAKVQAEIDRRINKLFELGILEK